MTGEEISKYAASGKLPEIEMNCAERALYWELKDSYGRYRAGEITRSEGENQKKEALKRFKADNDVLMYAKKIVGYHSRMWKEIECAADEYRKNPSIESADQFVRAVYGVDRKGEIESG